MNRARGQSLLIFSLTLLLVTLMVLVTLGIASRTKARMELQIATDAAAYSQAVATARTFNNAALLSRAEVATMVAMAGVQSLISWSGQQRGNIAAIGKALDKGGQRCPGDKQAIDKVQDQLDVKAAEIAKGFQELDDAAGTQVKMIQGAAGALGSEATAVFEENLKNDLLRDQKLVDAYVKRANPELRALPAGAYRTLTEVGGNDGPACLKEPCPTGGAVRSPNTTSTHLIFATMGSRGWTFTTSRSGPGATGNALGINGLNVAWAGGGGGGGSGFGYGAVGNFGAGAEDSQIDTKVNGVEAWAEDHGSLAAGVTPSRCNGNRNVVQTSNAWVRSTDLQNTEGRLDEHFYETGVDDKPVIERHTLGACIVCPGIWPHFLDYNQHQVDVEANDYGQPKLVAMVERDLQSAAADPWSLFFRFSFSGNSSAVFDNGSKLGAMATDPILQRQLAVTSSLVYYHRPSQGPGDSGWVEPPNFLNPFWRATLAAPDIGGGRADGDVLDAMQKSGYGAQAELMQKLQELGFRGFQ